MFEGSTLRSRLAGCARPVDFLQSHRTQQHRLGTPLLFSTSISDMSTSVKGRAGDRGGSDAIHVSVRSPVEIKEFTVKQVRTNVHTLTRVFFFFFFPCVKTRSRCRLILIVCAPQLKCGLAGQLGVPPESLLLIHSGQVVRESQVLSHLKRRDGTVRLCMIQR